ncbi:MAG: amino acid adenylation domain-containing protein [Candidatus Aminicenantes bacterium]|nr:amino acid adenylation domain-containing protein [Candidatus Aminicenantes bacterium]
MKNRGNIQDIYPLTPMQEGMLFQSLANPTSSAYFEQTIFRLSGELDIKAVKKSLDQLHMRHDILRTAFVHEGLERPMQVVLKNRMCDFSYRDIRRLETPEAQEQFIRDFAREDRRRIFNLARDVLMRVAAIRLDTNVYQFVWSHHHILIDGWCTRVLMLEFFEIHRSLMDNRPPQLPPVAAYRDYVLWLEKKDKKTAQEYWANYLEDYREPSTFSVIQKKGPHETEFQKEIARVILTREETDRLVEMAARNRVTLNNLIQTAWGILLGKYNNRQDVVFGSVVSGRPSEIPGVEKMVGLFINTIPFRLQYRDDTTIKEALQKVQENAARGEPHHYFPLARIQSLHLLKQNLLDHFVVFMNLPMARGLDGLETLGNRKNLAIMLAQSETFQQSHYNLDLAVIPDEQIQLRIDYNGSVYHHHYMLRLALHLKRLLAQMVENDAGLIAWCTLLTEAEKIQLLEEFNNTVEPYPRDKAIHRLVEDQVEKNPDQAAVFYEAQRFTYSETNERANQLARQLKKIGILPERVVGIVLERSIDMATAMLAVLKAGGAFLPIDPDAPDARNRLMLEENDPAAILTHTGQYRQIKTLLQPFSPTTAVLSIDDRKIYAGDRSNLENVNRPGDLAFVLYTSGTTGKPKGILLEHRNVNNFIHGLNRRVLSRYEKPLNIGLQAPFTFDGFAQMILGAMWYGHTAYILPNETRADGAAMLKYFKDHRIHISDGAPAQIRLMVESSQEHSLEMELKNLIIAGDVLPRKTAAAFLNRFRGRPPEVTNAYGPTECCGDSTMFHVTPGNENLYPTLPIGTPLPNEQVYIVDRFNKLQPIGVWGEVCIGGEGVTRGYLKREELTAGKFIPNPFKENGRLYRTGDLARWLDDGNIEFLGRIDKQVKIRGYRIEPEEVQHQLLNHEAVTAAVVIAGEDDSGDNFLCAYYVSDDSLDAGQLRRYLAKFLPSYMIPAYFTRLDKIPLTPRGKVDIDALPKPVGGIVTGKTYEPPGNETEEKIIAVWSEVLGVDAQKISALDDYYELGGNSINILNVLNRLNKEFEHTISLSFLILYPTVRELAANIHEQGILNKLECVIKLNKGGNKKNIFIIHPMNGQVYIYKDLAKLLENDYNIYGIQARGVVRRSGLAQSFPEMVEDYIYQIRVIQPEGPYLIMGHCIGDLIAFRMVKRLEEIKCKVERLIMTDEGAFTLEFVLNHFRRKERIRSLFKPFVAVGKLFKKKEKIVSPYADYDAAYNVEPEITSEESDRMKNKAHYHIQKLNRQYFRQNAFKIIDGIIRAPILDIKARDSEVRIEAGVVRKLTFGLFTLVESDGEHFTMFQKPHIFRLAEIIKNMDKISEKKA